MKKFITLLFILLCTMSIVHATPVGTVVSVPSSEQLVARGIVFDASIIKAELAPAASYNVLLTVAADTVMEIETGAESALKMVIYKDPTTAGGTALTATNNNDTSAITNDLITITAAPTTVSALGVTCWSEVAYDGKMSKRKVLDTGYTYLIGLTNISASVTGDVSIGLSFYKNALRLRP